MYTKIISEHILKEKTKSLCPICFEEIDGEVVELDGRVYLKKNCAVHGKFDVLIEKDASLYKALMNESSPLENTAHILYLCP